MTNNRRLLRVLAWCCLVVFLPTAVHATPTDFNFKDVELANIFQTIAVLGKFNVIIDPQVARAKMVVALKQVEPLDAMFLVARIQELKVKRVKWEEGSTTTTYAIGRPDKIEKGFETANSRTIQLKYAKAEDVAGILAKGLGKDVNIGVERDPRTNRLLLKGTEEVLTKVQDLVRDLDLPVPQILLDSKIVDVQTTYTKDLGFEWGFGVGGESPTKVTPNSGTVAAITEFQRNQPNASFYDSPGQAKGSSFFKFGDFFRQNLFFNASLQVLEAKGLVRTLAAPRLLAIQGSQAQLNIGDKIVFSGGPSQPPEERDTGLIMEITPRVNSDNFITMAIRVEQSTPRFDRPDFPTIKRTTTKTEVQVRDGEEVLVGGLVTEANNDSERKIPFLGDLPVIRHLFTRKTRNPTTQELVILVTPHVVKQNVTANAVDSEAPRPAAGNGGLPPAGGGDPLGGGDLDLGGDLGPTPGGSASPRPQPTGSPSPLGGGDLDLEGI